MSDNPFIPGARVAVGEKYGDGVTEGFVEKVHKSGRFTLKGSAQQWKPWKSTWSSGSRWSAMETGTGWGRCSLDIWDAETDKEITAKVEFTRFYGAECGSYPNCAGGCGCGCTKEVERARDAVGGSPKP